MNNKMKLLIIIQKVDINDGVLGFFHGWLEKLAEHCEKITVICLQKGEYDLPENVKVLSLGKENNASRLKYVFNFYKYIWRERKNYDAVFVHMNQEYVILGGLFWKIFGKKITMWRNHYAGSFLTDISVFFCDMIFCTSKHSYTAKYKKTIIMPAGIDTKIFKPELKVKKNNSILSLGRISPVKKIEILIKALDILDKNGLNFVCNIYGSAVGKDKEYYFQLKKQSQEMERRGKIIFYNGVPNYETPNIFNQNQIFVNATDTGSFDKTIVEAVACGCFPVVCNDSFKDFFRDIFLFKKDNALDLAKKIEMIINLNNESKEKYQKELRDFSFLHDVHLLVEKIINEFKK